MAKTTTKKPKTTADIANPVLESKTKLSDVLKIIFLEDYNPEVLQWEVVKKLQGSIEAADGVEDPIAVYRVDDTYWVIDGKHRLAALREIASQVQEYQKALEKRKAEFEALDNRIKEALKKDVDEAFEKYRREQEAKGKPIGTRKEQEKYREKLFDEARKTSSAISAEDRKKYSSLHALLHDKQKAQGDKSNSKSKSKTVFDWIIPFKITSFATKDELDAYYHQHLTEIDKSRAHDLKKINHLLDRYEIFKNRVDQDKWSYEKIARYYKTDLSTVNRVMQLRHVEISIRKFIEENEAANVKSHPVHKHRLKLGHIYRHISKASGLELIEVNQSAIPGYPASGNMKEKNTAAVLEFLRHEALCGKTHPECSYIGKQKSAKPVEAIDKKVVDALDVERLIAWAKSDERFKKVPWALVRQMLEEFQSTR